MSLLPNNTFASPGNSLYGGPNAGLQTLSQTGNTVSLSPSGGSVDIATTTLVADTAQKTTALTYDNGFLATTVNGELLIHGRTEVGEPLNPANLSVTGTLELGGAISDNSTSTGSAGQVLTAGAGGQAVWATPGGGGGVSSVNAGTNISIPDPGVPVVSVAITSDLDMANHSITSLNSINAYAFAQLGINAPGSVSIQTPQLAIPSLATYDANVLTVDAFGIVTTAPVPASTWVGTATSDLNMNGYNITTPSNLTIATDTGTVTISNPVVGVGGAQLNVNGSASIRGDTAQLQILDNAGSQKGSLSYNVIDGQTHLVGTDLAISSDNVVDITATADISLFASTGNINITAHESSIGLDSHTDIGISCNNGGNITVGGVNTTTVSVTAAGELILSGTGVGITANDGSSLTLSSTSGEISLTAGGNTSITSSGGGIELHANGSNLVLASSGDAVSISSGGGDHVSISAGGDGLILGTAGDLVMNGLAIQSTDFGTASGQYLRIKLNETYYKIQLLDDV